MILKASQRCGAKQLGMHLLKTEENEHVELHEIRVFVSDDIVGAFKEAYAISQGTKCRQFLFSVSLNPPQEESVSIDVFEGAINAIERKLGLVDQPRAIVFDEKEGRRHAHCVWSRIDAEEMKAVNIAHFKMKLRDISRELYLENGWQMPRGLADSRERDRLEQQALTDRQLDDRRILQRQVNQVRRSTASALSELHRDVTRYARMGEEALPKLKDAFQEARASRPEIGHTRVKKDRDRGPSI